MGPGQRIQAHPQKALNYKSSSNRERKVLTLVPRSTAIKICGTPQLLR